MEHIRSVRVHKVPMRLIVIALFKSRGVQKPIAAVMQRQSQDLIFKPLVVDSDLQVIVVYLKIVPNVIV